MAKWTIWEAKGQFSTLNVASSCFTRQTMLQIAHGYTHILRERKRKERERKSKKNSGIVVVIEEADLNCWRDRFRYIENEISDGHQGLTRELTPRNISKSSISRLEVLKRIGRTAVMQIEDLLALIVKRVLLLDSQRWHQWNV